MPRVKAVATLYSLSLNRITSILKTSNIPVNVERSIQQATDSEIESEINPFHRIPTTLLEDIINFLPINQTETKTFNIEFLITTELQKLIFYHFPCRFYCYEYEQYLNFFPKLEKLQVLVLPNTNVDDLCLKLIGTFCKKLRVLDVNECSKVSDIGVEWLVNQSSPELSKTLRELLIACPDVTKKGIKMAIQHFSALQVVESVHIFEVLVEVLQSAALAQHPPQILNVSFTRLKITIDASRELFKSSNFELVMKFCPSLLDITISVHKELTDTDLFCLTNVKNLQKLKIYSDKKSDEDEITFDKGLAPVLKVIGSSLKVLDITYFKFVDIWTIAKFCPNLVSLNFRSQCLSSIARLSENEIIQLRNEKGRVIFKELKVLVCGFNLTKDILFDLLSCPSLENVYIGFCNALTDDFLEEAISRNIFNNLKILRLESCNFVTKQGLDGLVKSDNNFEEMGFFFCDKITRVHFDEWLKFARHKNWQVILSFMDNNNTKLLMGYN